jgi:hypothetical protein
MPVEQLKLELYSQLITVHCFFGCPYIAQSSDPQEAHGLMEHHYSHTHTRQLEQIVARMTGNVPRKEEGAN